MISVRTGLTTMLVLTAGATVAGADGGRPTTLTAIADRAVCRNADGFRIAPAVTPSIPAQAEIEKDARAHLVVGAVDCFLNPNEFTTDTADVQRCSSARVAMAEPRIAGTRAIASGPHCGE